MKVRGVWPFTRLSKRRGGCMVGVLSLESQKPKYLILIGDCDGIFCGVWLGF